MLEGDGYIVSDDERPLHQTVVLQMDIAPPLTGCMRAFHDEPVDRSFYAGNVIGLRGVGFGSSRYVSSRRSCVAHLIEAFDSLTAAQLFAAE
ncbi:MAG: hypothetical protein ABW061_01540 [Polyangiaceae bacterium]